MNPVWAFLLQAADKPEAHAVGSEGAISRIVIIVFICGLAVAAAGAVWMVMKGAAGAAKAKGEKDEQK